MGGSKTKKAAVTAALAEYVRYKLRMQLLAAAGTFEWDEAYDYKAERRRDAEKLSRQIEEWSADEPRD